MADTSVKICICDHDSQDKIYGKKLRLHNGFKGKNGEQLWRCTVCLKERM